MKLLALSRTAKEIRARVDFAVAGVVEVAIDFGSATDDQRRIDAENWYLWQC